MKISLVSFDLSSNNLARFIDIAKILEEKHEVEIVGPMFGNQIWMPYANTFKYKKVKGQNFPRFFKSINEMLKKIEGDIIYASNLKLSSYGVSVFKKLMNNNKSLMVDISDWHLGYSLNQSAASVYKDAIHSINLPNGLIALLLMEYLIKYSDEVTVVSKFLQKKFGGIYLPQFVDTNIYDPTKFDREKLRENWNIEDKKIISFIGTPKPHKGIEELIHSVNILDNKYKIKIMMTGSKEDPYVKYLLSVGGERIIFLGQRPRHEEPIYLSMADLIVLPQRLTYFTMAQVPIKVMTAMSMAKPIIASRISDLPDILDGCGLLVNPEDVKELSESIAYMFDNPALAEKYSKKSRMKCIDRYSVEAVSEILYNMIDRLIK